MDAANRCVVVVGQLGRDIVLRIDDVPAADGSAAVHERIERLGGKGANQGVGLSQLGADVVLVAVAGTDTAGQQMVDEAASSGLDVSCVVRRGETALVVDIVDSGGHRRLLEHAPEASLLLEEDVRAAAHAFGRADTMCLQLQQPLPAVLAGAKLGRDAGARIVLDGAVEGQGIDELLAYADVVRADASEAELLTDMRIGDDADALHAAKSVLRRGPSVVAFGVPGTGDLVAWPGGSHFFAHMGTAPIDITGAGDAFTAGLVVGLRRGYDPEAAGHLAARAAAATVGEFGGRPDLSAVR